MPGSTILAMRYISIYVYMHGLPCYQGNALASHYLITYIYVGSHEGIQYHRSLTPLCIEGPTRPLLSMTISLTYTKVLCVFLGIAT